MRIINYLVPLLLASAAHAGLAEWQAAVSADNPRNWYRFDETSGTTLIDHGPGGLNGEYIEVGINQTGLFGPGQAANFPGQPDVDDRVVFADNWAEQTISGNWTAEFIVNKASAGEGISQALFNGAATSVRLEQWNSFNVYGDYRGGVTQYGVADYYLEGTVAPPDEWSHMVFVRSGSQTFIYLNGVHRGSMDAVVNLELQSVSRSNTGGEADKLHALLDEAVVYDRALSAAQIAAHFATTGITPPAVPPTITSQPQSQSIIIGSPDAQVTFNVVATGTLPLEFQWSRDGTPIEGATGETLTLTGVTSADAGAYSVVVSNSGGTETSADAMLDIVAPPFNEGSNQTVLNGFPASFSVTVPDVAGYSFQWSKDGAVLDGETASALVIPSATPADSGAYSVAVSFGADTAVAGPAMLIVPATPTQSYASTIGGDSPTVYYRMDDPTQAFTLTDEQGLLNGFFFSEVDNQQPGALLGDSSPSTAFRGTVESKAEVYESPANEFATPRFTVELWARRTGGSGAYGSPATFRYASGDPLAQQGWMFYANPANIWQFWIGHDADTWETIDGPPVINGEWIQLVGTYDGTAMAFYANGTLIERRETAYVPPDPTLAYTLRIGGGATEDANGNFFFIGDVDEVAVYGEALTPAQVAAHYAAAFSPNVAPVIDVQPRSTEVLLGGSVTLSVGVVSGSPPSYQWKKDGADLPGETAASLTIANADAGATGAYAVEITNAAGSVTSDTATVGVVGPEATYLATILRDGPVAYWRLDETSGTVAEDYVGNHDGVYMNGVVLGEPGAIANDDNGAAAFVQANQTFVEVPWAADVNSPEFTFECWAKLTGGTSYRSPMTSRGDGPQEGFIFYATPANVWEFWNGTGAGWSAMGGGAIQSGVWYHLAGTYDGATKRFFVNGQQVGSAQVGFVPNDFDVLRIGAGATESPTGNYFFEGTVDEAAVYDIALSPARILTHYLAGRPAAPEIGIALDGGEVVLTWNGAATLQEAASVTGPWSDVAGATSPHRVTPASGPVFWRLSTP
ncbi:MAG: immunoglobulin domain-containing protein [Verrucomicrobiales bacterium]|nr:immunoglobulin domain-containing protein [Verrucomicrobiales bacterium]